MLDVAPFITSIREIDPSSKSSIVVSPLPLVNGISLKYALIFEVPKRLRDPIPRIVNRLVFNAPLCTKTPGVLFST